MNTKITFSVVLICLLATPNILSVGQFTNAKTYTGYESLRQLPAITIASNGSVIPQNGIVQQVGNEYRLTRNLTDQYSIQIYCSAIVFDGQGNCLDGCGLSGSGLTLVNVRNSTVQNIVIRNFPQACISIDNSSENNFIEIQCDGLELYKSDNNNFSKSAMGLSMTSSSHNRFFNNNFSGSVCGVGLNYCSDNLFFDNNIEHLLCYYSSNNLFYHNNIDSADLLYESSWIPNSWDNGKEGNYWSDYKAKYPYAGEIGGSGVGNAPYVIDEQNVDRYPLLQPFDSTLYAHRIMPKISVLSPVNQVFNESSVPLIFTVDKQVGWVGYSLDGQDNVTITGNSTLNGLTNGLHKITVYANDTFGNTCSSETVAFSVAVAAPAPFVLASAGLGIAVLIVGVGLFYYVKKRLDASRGRRQP